MSQDQTSESRRGESRHPVPLGVSVSLVLASKQSVFVNLRDVSTAGACVVRQGSLDIKEDDSVVFEARNYDTGSTITLRSRVRWLRNTGFNTYAGLSFIDGSLSPKSLLKLFS
ncbi:PilZ domain-containing protein [Synechococcus sp. CCY 9618]|uniref:PilZ domain-containing protein n=1 Tax=Synechococcus sp. CCY 9618 TaxID=2815602 RepID=UPI0021110440|nr:PilZ domain-containing protein [Synechococcus sp. CCY 9618]